MVKSVSIAVVMAGTASMASADPLGITYHRQLNLTGSATDQASNVYTPSELSGITWSGNGGLFYAVSDSDKRLVEINITFSPTTGLPTSAAFGAARTMNYTGASDFEGVYFSPQRPSSIYISDEATNAFYEFDKATGSQTQWVLPSFPSQPRTNLSLESMTGTGSTLWTANEEALTNDGSISTTSNGTVVRLQKFGVNGLAITPQGQYAYVTNPIHAAVLNDSEASSRSGLSDLIALPDGRLIALERSFAFNQFIFSTYKSSIFEINLNGATDVSAIASLEGATYTPATKTELWSRTSSGITSDGIGNLEGLTLGPRLDDGRYIVLGIIDDGDPFSQNRIVVFTLTGVPEPASMLLLPAAGTLLLRRRMR